MIGLMLLGAFGLYVVVSIIVVTITYRTAKRNGASPTRARRAAGVATLVMYLLLFWDWVPTVVAKQYYCRTQGGFYLYKTLEQWKQENPGVAETLVAPTRVQSVTEGKTTKYFLNQRFVWQIRERDLPILPVTIREEQLLDQRTGESLARLVEVGTGHGNPNVSGEWQGGKVWLRQGPCDGTGRARREFANLEVAAKKLGVRQ